PALKSTDTYHHGHLREELLRLGLEALETEGAQLLSLRSLSERAGVSKTAPYRHFKDKDAFLGALADEGFRLLHTRLEQVIPNPKATLRPAMRPQPGTAQVGTTVAAMGRAYMDFAIDHPALYRLMSSSLVCTLPSELTQWARRSLLLLARSLQPTTAGDNGAIDIDATVAAWAYIHGLVSIRIDGLFPADLPEPQWERLAGIVPVVPSAVFSGKLT
ncbi:MAG: TetR/AcrR family transcriptional regulator, partial [Spirochaetia bacterium]|nr:TetR/AcrR family transcriptional regulator [Spirochaetia bacterium]